MSRYRYGIALCVLNMPAITVFASSGASWQHTHQAGRLSLPPVWLLSLLWRPYKTQCSCTLSTLRHETAHFPSHSCTWPRPHPRKWSSLAGSTPWHRSQSSGTGTGCWPVTSHSCCQATTVRWAGAGRLPCRRRQLIVPWWGGGPFLSTSLLDAGLREY